VLQVRSAPILGLGVVGWVTAGLFLSALFTLVFRNVRRFGPADRVTMTRALLVGVVTVLVAESFVRHVPIAMIVTIASVALVLDLVDGKVARRSGTASEFGARFDMEVDAFLILALSVYVARSLGWWVLAIGAMRYAYAAAGWVWRWLTRPAPPRYWCKVVAAIQGIVLTVAAGAVLPWMVNLVAVIGALALLIESFGRDVLWQWRHRSGTPAGINVPGPAKRPKRIKQAHQPGPV
jgi:phosphatidylglycerophosphate synthase